MCERYTSRLPLTHPQQGTWPTTQACTLTGNRTSDLSVCSPHSIHWATPARAQNAPNFSKNSYILVESTFRVSYSSWRI